MKSKTKTVILAMAAVFTILAIIFIFLYQIEKSSLRSTLAVTFCTTAYHFNIRLMIKNLLEHNKDSLSFKGGWFRVSPTEMKFYELIKVKKWKGKLPTYTPDDFNIHKHSLEEILQNMYVAEVGHELMIVAGYISLLFSFFTGDREGSFRIFLITASCAALVELIFVIVQRYNRQRMFLALQKWKNKRNFNEVSAYASFGKHF
ncbi:MAG: hypothetical protein EOM28_02455 [Clostridia bacterium]|nr:hypothetical protein [Clostridia bacterium]